MLEYIVFRSWNLGEAILTRLSIYPMPIFDKIKTVGAGFDEHELQSMLREDLSLISWLDYGSFLTSLEVWVGLIICGLFVTEARSTYASTILRRRLVTGSGGLPEISNLRRLDRETGDSLGPSRFAAVF